LNCYREKREEEELEGRGGVRGEGGGGVRGRRMS
jgi:hypothetical protein